MCCLAVCGIADWRVWNARSRNRLEVARWGEGMVILEAWLKLDFSESSVDSVGLWMGTVLGPLQVLWYILGPRVHRGIAATSVGWFVLVTLGLWLTWILGNLGITTVCLVLEQVTGTVVTVIPVWSVDSVGVLGSRVLSVPLVSMGSVVSVAVVVCSMMCGGCVLTLGLWHVFRKYCRARWTSSSHASGFSRNALSHSSQVSP